MRKNQDETPKIGSDSQPKSPSGARSIRRQEQDLRVRAQLEKMLDLGLVTVHLNATLPEVDVPPELKGDEHLLLNLSYRFAKANLSLDAKTISATLTFGEKTYRCVLPYNSIYICQSAVSGQLSFYPDNMPKNLLRQLEAMQKLSQREFESEPEVKKVSKAPRQGKLKIISGGNNAHKAKAAGGAKEAKKRDKQPELRVLSGGKES